MKVIMINDANKTALYKKYLSIFDAHHQDPEFFTLRQSNAELSTVMGGRPWSWHVIGITNAALIRYKELNFKHVSKSGITRAHIQPRFITTKILISGDRPFEIDCFFDLWLKSDKTIICGAGENTKEFNSKYIAIENDDYHLFASSTIGWKFSIKREGQYLRRLYENIVIL
jgi:hypothetical protein